MSFRDLLLALSLLLFLAAIVCGVRSLNSTKAVKSAVTSGASSDIQFCQSTSDQLEADPPSNDRNIANAEKLNFERHAAALRKKLPKKFTVCVEKPFVVIGDQTPDEVERWSSGTIRWAVKQIKDQYFEADPDHIIDVWLFKDKESYQKNVAALFGRKPTTPYGYYSPADKALVMNISTGGGTLVHEIVHPFMAANFKSCPAWFNEGLASLYEQSSERNGKIVGLTNWRLRGLQLAVKDGFLGSFESMMNTNDREFYDGESTNYAQARYLCYWLQENDLLNTYFHKFRDNAIRDPSGIATLKAVLKNEDLAAFQRTWEQFVLDLEF